MTKTVVADSVGSTARQCFDIRDHRDLSSQSDRKQGDMLVLVGFCDIGNNGSNEIEVRGS